MIGTSVKSTSQQNYQINSCTNTSQKKMSKDLTDEQLAEIKEAFDLYDKNQQGKISVDMIGTVIRSVGRNPTQQEVKEMIEDADPEKTGFVTYEQFLKLVKRAPTRAELEEEVQEAFKVFDKDNKGLIPLAELRHVLTTLGEKLTTDEVDEVLKDAKVDKDGNINYITFVKMLLPQK